MTKAGPKTSSKVQEPTGSLPQSVPQGTTADSMADAPSRDVALRLPKVDGRYGAPMGRIGGSSPSPEGTVTISKVSLDSGGYDVGGAYWGIPNNLYMADDGDGFTRFLRAEDRAAATAEIQAEFPDAAFGHEPDYDAFLAGYLACAAWSGPSEDDGLDFQPEDFTKQAIRVAEADCRAFVDANWKDLCGLDESDSGHNFWLTRNHHGTGFWDRDQIPKEIRDRLTEASHEAGEVNVWTSKRKRLNFE
jgi:hypothetical protein